MSSPYETNQYARNDSMRDAFGALDIKEHGREDDKFDARFTVVDKPARFFNIGRVFKTLWIQPAGNTAKDTDQPAYSTVGYGQLSHAKVRPFVVIRKRLHSCLCLGISSYGGQGAAKEDVRSQDHAVVYPSTDAKPIYLPWEQIVLDAFPIIVEEPNETIAPMSRLDFGKVYTIEHNVRVLRIGRVSPDHIKRLNECFAEIMGFPTPTEDLSDLSGTDPAGYYNGSPVDAAEKGGKQYSVYGPLDTLTHRHPSAPDPAERIDKTYYIRTKNWKSFFRVGRVFSTLWTDALGGNTDSVDQTFVSEVIYHERVFSKVRQFVIVREGDRSVTCLPVTSYNGAAFRKTGIRLSDHGFIYSHQCPKPVKGMMARPLKVLLARHADHLHGEAMVNYAKVYTLETNVKVKDVGELDSGSRGILLHYFRKVFMGSDDDVDTPRTVTPLPLGSLSGVGSWYPPPNSQYSPGSGYPAGANYTYDESSSVVAPNAGSSIPDLSARHPIDGSLADILSPSLRLQDSSDNYLATTSRPSTTYTSPSYPAGSYSGSGYHDSTVPVVNISNSAEPMESTEPDHYSHYKPVSSTASAPVHDNSSVQNASYSDSQPGHQPSSGNAVWYKDPKTGRFYQDRKDSRGRTIRTYVDDQRNRGAKDRRASQKSTSVSTSSGAKSGNGSSEFWYKDARTGDLYQDKKDSRGKIIRTYIKDTRESQAPSSRSAIGHTDSSHDVPYGAAEPSVPVQISSSSKQYHPAAGYGTSQEYASRDYGLNEEYASVDLSPNDDYIVSSAETDADIVLPTLQDAQQRDEHRQRRESISDGKRKERRQRYS